MILKPLIQTTAGVLLLACACAVHAAPLWPVDGQPLAAPVAPPLLAVATAAGPALPASAMPMAAPLQPALAPPSVPLLSVVSLSLLQVTPAAVATLADLPAPTAALGKSPAPSSPLVQRLREGASELVMASMNFLGVPYRRGGDSAEGGFDCSGFTRHVFEHTLGLVLPRRAAEQARDDKLATISRDQLKPGDLVFFNTMRRAFSHVGIYIGDGRFIHAPRSGSTVRVDDLQQAYWSRRFDGARRADVSVAALLPSLTSATAAPGMPGAQADESGTRSSRR